MLQTCRKRLADAIEDAVGRRRGARRARVVGRARDRLTTPRAQGLRARRAPRFGGDPDRAGEDAASGTISRVPSASPCPEHAQSARRAEPADLLIHLAARACDQLHRLVSQMEIDPRLAYDRPSSRGAIRAVGEQPRPTTRAYRGDRPTLRRRFSKRRGRSSPGADSPDLYGPTAIRSRSTYRNPTGAGAPSAPASRGSSKEPDGC